MELFRPAAPVWVLVFPFISAVFAVLLPFVSGRLSTTRREELEKAADLLTPTVSLAVGLFLICTWAATRSGAPMEADFRWTPDRFQMRLRLDAASELFGVLLCLMLATGSLKPGLRRGSSSGVLLAALGCGLGALMAADMIALIFFWMTMALLCSWPVVDSEAGGAFLCWMIGATLLAALGLIGFASVARDYHIPSAGVSLIGREVELLAPSGLGVALAFFVGAVIAMPRSITGDGTIAGAPACAFLVPGYVLLRVAHELLPAYAGSSLTGFLTGAGLLTATLAGAGCALAGDFMWKARLCIVSQAGFWVGWMGLAMGSARRPALADMAAYFLILGSLVSLLDVWAGATRDRREKQAAARRFPAGAVVVAAAACAVAILPFIGFLEALWSGTSWRWLGVIGLGAAVASAASLVVQRFAKAAPRDALQARLAILWAVILLLALLLQPFLSSQLSRVFVERLPTF